MYNSISYFLTAIKIFTWAAQEADTEHERFADTMSIRGTSTFDEVKLAFAAIKSRCATLRPLAEELIHINRKNMDLVRYP